MSLPNDFAIVQAVFNSRDWQIHTHAGLRDFTEAVVVALHAHDPNWGHLRKYGGQTNIEGRAEDSALYRVPEANGKRRSVDFVLDANASTARPGWGPDTQARYAEADWYAPSGATSTPTKPTPTPPPPAVKPCPDPSAHGPRPAPCPDLSAHDSPRPLTHIFDDDLLAIAEEFDHRGKRDDIGGMVDAGSQFGRRLQAGYSRGQALADVRAWITQWYGPRKA
jgi:hypothetical protein